MICRDAQQCVYVEELARVIDDWLSQDRADWLNEMALIEQKAPMFSEREPPKAFPVSLELYFVAQCRLRPVG